MCNVWNEKDLVIPAFATYSTFDKIDIVGLKSITNDLIRTIGDNNKILFKEGAYLSRLIFMFCKQFRMFKGFHEMKKLNQALLRYLNMDVTGILENFHGFLPDPDGAKKFRVPYRDNIDYVLLKLHGLSKLFLRMTECARKSANYFMGLLYNGSFLLKSLIFIATIAKIWNISRELCKIIVSSFNQIVKFRNQLKPKGLKWLPKEYVFPEKLEEQLNDYVELVMKEDRQIEALMNMGSEDNIENETLDKIVDDGDTMDDAEDLGVPISRSSISEIKTIGQHLVNELVSKESVNTFFKNESKYRKLDPSKSMTIKKLKGKKFKLLKEDIKRKSLLMQEKPFVEYCKNLLSNLK